MHCFIVVPPQVSDKSKIYDHELTHIVKTHTDVPQWFPFAQATGKIHFNIFTACLNKIMSNPDTAPHLAPMEVCKQKSPIVWYFSVLPLLKYWQSGQIFHSIHYDI